MTNKKSWTDENGDIWSWDDTKEVWTNGKGDETEFSPEEWEIEEEYIREQMFPDDEDGSQEEDFYEDLSEL